MISGIIYLYFIHCYICENIYNIHMDKKILIIVVAIILFLLGIIGAFIYFRKK